MGPANWKQLHDLMVRCSKPKSLSSSERQPNSPILMAPASDLKTSSIDLFKGADINNGIEFQDPSFLGTVRIEHLEALLARHFGHLRPSVKLWIGGGSVVKSVMFFFTSFYQSLQKKR